MLAARQAVGAPQRLAPAQIACSGSMPMTRAAVYIRAMTFLMDGTCGGNAQRRRELAPGVVGEMCGSWQDCGLELVLGYALADTLRVAFAINAVEAGAAEGGGVIAIIVRHAADGAVATAAGGVAVAGVEGDFANAVRLVRATL